MKKMNNYSDLSRIVSHALRHEPWIYELELDDEGWVPVQSLLLALNKLGEPWKEVTEETLALMIEHSDKKRHQIKNGKIKALYGHSLIGKLAKTPAIPPDILYHGTSKDFAQSIQQVGLLPMNRQYVHLSTNVETAIQVGLRKDNRPLLLEINAKEAYMDGVVFYQGNEQVWLVDKLSSKYVQNLI